jgi:hypothetical protein
MHKQNKLKSQLKAKQLKISKLCKEVFKVLIIWRIKQIKNIRVLTQMGKSMGKEDILMKEVIFIKVLSNLTKSTVKV